MIHCFELNDVLNNGIIFCFYLGLPHTLFSCAIVHGYNQLQNLRTCTLLSQERGLETSTKVQVHVTVYERYLKKKKICSI